MGGICSGTSCSRCAAATPTALFLGLSCHPSGQTTQLTPSYQGLPGPGVGWAFCFLRWHRAHHCPGHQAQVCVALPLSRGPRALPATPPAGHATLSPCPRIFHRLFAGPGMAWFAASAADGAGGLRTTSAFLAVLAPPSGSPCGSRPSLCSPGSTQGPVFASARCWHLV